MDGKRRVLKRFKPGESFAWEPRAPVAAGGASRRRSPSRKAPDYSGKTLLFRPSKNLFEVNGKPYRGLLVVAFSQKTAVPVNDVGIEDYTRGVVGSEIGSQSPEETLKSQSVIVRTYAIANSGKHGANGFDVCDREHCQVYGGVKAERPSIDEAVHHTRGIIMICAGKPISTLYHATCGGMTSDNEKVFGGGAVPYLRRVVCPFCKDGTNFRWHRTIPVAQILKNLASEGKAAARILTASTVSDAPLDRVVNVVFHTDRGEIGVKGTTFRRWFNLPSTTFVSESGGSSTGNPRLAEMQRIPDAKPPQVKTRLVSATIEGPPQIVIQSGQGLRRARRPVGGWAILGVSAFSDSGQPLDTVRQGQLPSRKGASILSEIRIMGRGYGHQVGLCQAGARQLGKRRWSYRQILAFYYSRVALRRLTY